MKIEKTPLDLLNEGIQKKLKQKESNKKYFTEHREKWNEYQARYMRDRRHRDPEFRKRLNDATNRWISKQKQQLQNA